MGLVPFPGCVTAVPKANHTLQCHILAPIEVGTIPAASWSSHGQQPPPQNQILESSCAPNPTAAPALHEHFFILSPQINLSPPSWPEWCHLKGWCDPLCHPLHLVSVPWEPWEG